MCRNWRPRTRRATVALEHCIASAAPPREAASRRPGHNSGTNQPPPGHGGDGWPRPYRGPPPAVRDDDVMTLSADFSKIDDDQRPAEIRKLCEAMDAAD